MIRGTNDRRILDHETVVTISSKKMHGMLAMRSLQNIKVLPNTVGPSRKNLYTAWKNQPSHHDIMKDSDLDEDSKNFSSIKWNKKSAVADVQPIYQKVALPIRASSHTKVPNEILLAICQDSILTEQDWYYLCYVRIFHDAATELLYREINVHESNLFLALRTLLRYPKHAAMVKVLDIERSRRINAPDNADSRVLLEHARQNGLFVDDERTWHKQLGFDWAVTLFMLITPNVQRLSIGDFFISRTQQRYLLPGVADLGMTVHIPSFQNLKKLFLRYPARIYAHHLAPLFKLPSLETLIVWLFEGGIGRKDTRDPSIFGPEHTSSINTIHLYNGDIHFDTLAAMLKSCKSLRALALDLCDLYSNEDKKIKITSFSQVLEPFRNNLRFISLANVLRPISSVQCVSLGSFTDFESLESICVNLDAFHGLDPRQWFPVLDLLPGSVKEVHLEPGSVIDEDPTSRLIFAPDGLLSTLCSNANLLPRLEYLTFGLGSHSIEDADLQDLKEQLRRRGVEVKPWKRFRWERNGPACDDLYGYIKFADLG